MMRAASIAFAFIAALWFPWPLAILGMCLAAAYEPLAALAVGLFADALYFTHGAYPFPLMTLVGAGAALGAVLVRKFFETRIIAG
ncbi:MAG: hypothetical protein WDN10_01185 [bacterium]